jgi:hypothetical protein
MYLGKLREKYDKIIAVVPYPASCIITNADEIITANDSLSAVGGNFPEVLDAPNRAQRGYVKTGFMKKAIQFNKEEVDYILFTTEKQFDIRMFPDLPKSCKIHNQPHLNVLQFIYEDFKEIISQIKNGHRILPFESDKEHIEKKYGHLFNDKTYIILTRNFKNKQPRIHNTEPELEEKITEAVNGGYRIVNVGFPCMPFNIQSDNYFEISDNLTYSEFLCLGYLANAMFIPGHSGAFSTHIATSLNLFAMPRWWGHGDKLFMQRMECNDLISEISENMLETIKSTKISKEGYKYISKANIKFVDK